MDSRQEQEEMRRTAARAADKQRAGQTIGGCDVANTATPIRPLGLGVGPEVPTIWAINQRLAAVQREHQLLIEARQFLTNDTPTGEQVALGLTALRALGYSL